jgi:hypothetical protein
MISRPARPDATGAIGMPSGVPSPWPSKGLPDASVIGDSGVCSSGLGGVGRATEQYQRVGGVGPGHENTGESLAPAFEQVLTNGFPPAAPR